MPARRLDATPAIVRLYDVVGIDAATGDHFIRHVGLSREAIAGCTETTAVGLAHMGPPFDRSGPPTPVQCVGGVPLTNDEAEQLGLFIDELELEYAATSASSLRQYVVCPHCVTDPETDTTPTRRRFSCGGFVIEAYRFVGIDLLVTDATSLPRVGLDTINRAYPDLQRELSRPAIRRSVGLDGPGPWPIVLAGYVLNALRRDDVEIRSRPHPPQVGEEYYPAPAPQPWPEGINDAAA